MTSRSSYEPIRSVSEPSQPPAWTLESWPESPIAITFTLRCRACDMTRAVSRVLAIPASSRISTA